MLGLGIRLGLTDSSSSKASVLAVITSLLPLSGVVGLTLSVVGTDMNKVNQVIIGGVVTPMVIQTPTLIRSANTTGQGFIIV